MFENKKAYHDYFIQETLEAGVMLVGKEVKAIRAKKISMVGGWVKYLQGAWYWMGEINSGDPKDSWRERKLLIKKSESNKLIGKVNEKGYTVIPVKGYFKGNVFKVEIALCKGKKDHDKRQTLKERDSKRDVEMSMKQNRI